MIKLTVINLVRSKLGQAFVRCLKQYGAVKNVLILKYIACKFLKLTV